MKKLSSILLPTIIGISVYIVVSKLFPEKDLRGGDIVRNNLIKEIIKKMLNDRALKIALISVFATAGVQYFNQEIEKLLVDDVFNQICVKEVDGQLKIVCDIIKEHELNLHSKSIKELIVSSNLSKDDKINLLKIKLDFIINGECAGKKRFVIISILAALITVCVSGVGGLAIFLEALYRLFQEGKISRALYEQILKIVTKKVTKVPVNHTL
jgi:hypothetical protein